MSILYAFYAVQCVGIICTSSSSFYIIKKGLFVKTSDVTYLNLFISDFFYAVLGLFVTYRRQGLMHYRDLTLKNVVDKLEASGDTKNFGTMAFMFFSITARMIVCMSIFPIIYDRFIAIFKPPHYHSERHRYQVWIGIGSCWIFPVIYGAVMMAFLSVKEIANLYVQRTLWSTTWVTTFFVVPLIYSIMCFTLISLHFYRQPGRKCKVMLIATVIRALLTSFFFTIAWMPLYVKIIITNDLMSTPFEEGLLYSVFLYTNSTSDPVMYFLPRNAIQKFVVGVLNAFDSVSLYYNYPKYYDCMTKSLKHWNSSGIRRNDKRNTILPGIRDDGHCIVVKAPF